MSSTVEQCRTDSACCFQDDSGSNTLKHVCVGLSAALILCILGLIWGAASWKLLSRQGNANRTTTKEVNADITSTDPSRVEAARSTNASVHSPDPAQPQRVVKAIRSSKSGEMTTAGSPDSFVGAAAMDDNDDHELNAGHRNSNNYSSNPRELRKQVSIRSLRSLKSTKSFDHMEMQLRWNAGPPSPASVAADDVQRLRLLLDTERSRRMAAESVLSRRSSTSSIGGTPSLRSLSMRKFPSPRVIEAHALEAASNAGRWVRSAATRSGSQEPDLITLVRDILVELFESCRGKIRKRLDARVAGLRLFVGEAEGVQFGQWGESGVSSLAGDTQELLYGELRRRFPTIAAIGRQELVSLCAGVLSRALDTEGKREVGRMLVHQTWPSFEPLVRSYLALFVECALQQPEVQFEEGNGWEVAFDPEKHREVGRMEETAALKEIGSTCFVVFPAMTSAYGRIPTPDAAKGGVIFQAVQVGGVS